MVKGATKLQLKLFVPKYDECHNLFWDTEYMVKCSRATTDAALMKCAGYNYFKYLMDFINQHYILYDGGMEGIRNGCLENSDRACFYHSTLSTVDFIVMLFLHHKIMVQVFITLHWKSLLYISVLHHLLTHQVKGFLLNLVSFVLAINF